MTKMIDCVCLCVFVLSHTHSSHLTMDLDNNVNMVVAPDETKVLL